MSGGLSLVLPLFFLLRFRLYVSVEAAALRAIALRYADAPIATRVCLFFSFCSFGDVAFSEYFFCTIAIFSLYGEYVVRSFLPDGVFFYLVTTGWIFDISLCENSNQSIKYSPCRDTRQNKTKIM